MHRAFLGQSEKKSINFHFVPNFLRYNLGNMKQTSWWTFHLESVIFLGIIYLVVLVHPQQLRYNKELSKHVTNLLDGLLKEDRYDKRIRPNFGGKLRICGLKDWLVFKNWHVIFAIHAWLQKYRTVSWSICCLLRSIICSPYVLFNEQTYG